jgi:hypothetical protein
MDSLTDALGLLVAALEHLRIRYLIGGSVASSAAGAPRSTLDVDLLAEIGGLQAADFAALLGRDWYADQQAIRDAIQAGYPFNVIHIPSGQKFDIFPAGEEFHQSELSRATPVSFDVPGRTIRCPVATAEDILLAKLRWYRSGGEVSERQWTDVLGILAMNPAADRDYLLAWAKRLRVEDLLARAIHESASESG